MTKKQIRALEWAVQMAEFGLQDSSSEREERMREAHAAITAIKLGPHEDHWLDANIRLSDATAGLDMAARFAERAGASLLIRNGIREIRERAISIRNLMAFPEQQPGAAPDPPPESGLRKRHLEAIRELHKVAHDAWFGDETLAAAEKDSGNHGPDEIAAIEANLATVKEAIAIMEKEGLGFIS